jgi:tetratricopeptide (TPR) repeat protein
VPQLPIRPKGQRLINWPGFPRSGGIALSATETFDVFFSYNRKDAEAVRRLAAELKRQGLRVWIDAENLPFGRTWQPHVENALQSVRSAAILLGPASFGDWQKEEARLCLTQGVKRDIPVIPVLLPGGSDPEALPEFLRERTCCDLRHDPGSTQLQRLIAEIRGEVFESAPEPPPAEPGPGPRRHNLPFLALNDLFKGRDVDLKALEASLASPTSTATAITQAIHGLGGIGKTRLAVEYAWRSGDRYDATLFVVADSPEALQSGLAGLARLGLPGLSPSPSRAQEEDVAAVLDWFRDHSRWLLILDNVDTPEAAEAVRSILPQLQSGHVLITSRRKNWPPGIRKQPLNELKLEEATAFLLQRTEEARSKTTDDPQQAESLAKILDGLPLALEQAAAYIAHHQITFSEYLSIWEKEKESVLDWHDEDQTQYPNSVATTWQTTFRQLGPTAAAILRLTAYMAPDPISVEMFEKGAGLVEQGAKRLIEETGTTADFKPIREGIAELAAYSMVTREDRTVTVHRVVQEVLRTRIPPESQREWIELALRLANDFSPPEPEDVRTWPIWNLLRPHAGEVVRYADAAGIANPTARLMTELNVHLQAKGLYKEAEPLIRRALAIEEQMHPDSSDVAVYLNELALVLQATNRLAEAEPLMRRALTIDEEAFGRQHPNVAIDLNYLARLLQDTNRLAEAEPLMREAVEIFEASLGPDHPRSKIVRGNLERLEKRLLSQTAAKLSEDALRKVWDNPDDAEYDDL